MRLNLCYLTIFFCSTLASCQEIIDYRDLTNSLDELIVQKVLQAPPPPMETDSKIDFDKTDRFKCYSLSHYDHEFSISNHYEIIIEKLTSLGAPRTAQLKVQKLELSKIEEQSNLNMQLEESRNNKGASRDTCLNIAFSNLAILDDYAAFEITSGFGKVSEFRLIIFSMRNYEIVYDGIISVR